MSYYLYVYSPSDFVDPLPNERFGSAAGKLPVTLTLKSGATGTRIEVKDDDSIFDEVDGSQTLAAEVNLDGTTYTAGTTIQSAYDLSNSETGHKVTSLHFDGNGYQQGAVHGAVSTVPLEPGEPYSFDRAVTSHHVANAYDQYVACFCAGALIRTSRGEVAVEHLQAGDRIITEDDGEQILRWIGARTVPGRGGFAPVRLRAGYLGLTSDLLVSQQHRMVVSGPAVELGFGTDVAFVAAKHLCDGKVAVIEPATQVTYYHLLFDHHQVIFANGAATESFLPQTAALHGLGRAAMQELTALFPDLCRDAPIRPLCAARMCLKAYEAAVVAI